MTDMTEISPSNLPPARVYIVDDDTAVRDSLLWLMESVGYNASAFANAGEFLGALDAAAPGVILLDVRMPDIGGFQLNKLLQERGSCLSTIFMTAHGDVPMSVRAMKAGALDFVEKPFNYQTMLDTVETGITQSQARHAELMDRRKLDARLALLTKRERCVLNLMVDGYMTKEIAFDLGISAKTVEIHRSNIRKKLGEFRIALIVSMVATTGLIDK